MSLIAINYAQLDGFRAKALKLAEVMAELASSPVMNNFKRTLILAMSMGYKDYPTMYLSSKKRNNDPSELLLFQNREMNERIAKMFSEESKHLDFEKAKIGLKVLAEWEKKQSENVSLLIKKHIVDPSDKPLKNSKPVFKTPPQFKVDRATAIMNRAFGGTRAFA